MLNNILRSVLVVAWVSGAEHGNVSVRNLHVATEEPFCFVSSAFCTSYHMILDPQKNTLSYSDFSTRKGKTFHIQNITRMSSSIDTLKSVMRNHELAQCTRRY
jgi:hypothetical protein